MRNVHGLDKLLLATTAVLIFAGFLIFTSASFGLLTRDGAQLGSVTFNQLLLGLGGGLVAGFIAYRTPYQLIRKNAFYIFIATLLLTLAVFIPGLGFAAKGAHRWIHLGPLSLQPSEFLKFGFILFFATWLSGIKNEVRTWKHGFLPMIGIIGVVALVMLAQPDTGTFLSLLATGIGMYFLAGAPWKHFAVLFGCMVIGIILLATFRPYVMARITTFVDPSSDPYNTSYHARQAFVAIGSGGLVGRGFGQSIQKFNYLPEPIGDSIFAVFSEEFGLLGGTILLGLFILFMVRGFKISQESPNGFARLASGGIVILILAQSFLNIGAMLGVVPLTGLPLIFVSHGGTALLVSLAEVGFLLQLSQHTETT